MVEKAQQLPQKSWFLTGVTAPCCTQLTSSATTALACVNVPEAGVLTRQSSAHFTTCTNGSKQVLSMVKVDQVPGRGHHVPSQVRWAGRCLKSMQLTIPVHIPECAVGPRVQAQVRAAKFFG